MKSYSIPFVKTQKFNPTFIDYLNEKSEFQSFISQFPNPKNFAQAIKNRSFSLERRKILVETLEQQYQEAQLTPPNTLQLLSQESTFTVCTGHQLNIFTGPLYFTYKIITTINLAETLQKLYPENRFVPVYYMATEDHDFAEIAHFNLFNKQYKFETEEKGAVGKMSTDGIGSLIEQISDMPDVFKNAYNQSTLAEATFQLVHNLFSEYGLLVLEPDKPALKNLFKSVIKADVFENAFLPKVEAQSAALESLGYPSQIYPRPINFFYLEKNLRARIEKVNENQYKVVDTDLVFSENQLQDCIEQTPEKFSPNVVLRPLYQEYILPNLSYIGGPAELAYWLQLKPTFDVTNTPFPILMPRHCAMVIPSKIQTLLSEWNIKIEDLFLDKHLLKKEVLKNNLPQVFSMQEEKDMLEQLMNNTLEKTKKVTKGMERFISAEFHKVQKNLEKIEKKVQKQQEHENAQLVNKFNGAYEKLFPNGSLQERVSNVMNFYINDPDFIAKVKDAVDPFAFEFAIHLQDPL